MLINGIRPHANIGRIAHTRRNQARSKQVHVLVIALPKLAGAARRVRHFQNDAMTEILLDAGVPLHRVGSRIVWTNREWSRQTSRSKRWIREQVLNKLLCKRLLVIERSCVTSELQLVRVDVVEVNAAARTEDRSRTSLVRNTKTRAEALLVGLHNTRAIGRVG